MEIPVYIFTGFLEAGKTKSARETLADERFNSGEKTLLLLCEEGEEEYGVSFPNTDVTIVTVDEEQDLTQKFLSEQGKKCKADRVVVEYNGMWKLETLYQALPKNWMVYQELMFADARTFSGFNTNLRSLVVDKLQGCELVVFNRVDERTDRKALHKIVRGVSRNASISYELTDGTLEYDEIEDPLPFDINAPVIRIEDKDYAWWYRDFTEDMGKYIGKKICFKAIVAKDRKMPEGTVVAGRHIMTCCADDIAYRGIVCKYTALFSLKTRDWVMVEGELKHEYHDLYCGKGPVLYASMISMTEPPEQPVATFD